MAFWIICALMARVRLPWSTMRTANRCAWMLLVFSSQHAANVSQEQLHADVMSMCSMLLSPPTWWMRIPSFSSTPPVVLLSAARRVIAVLPAARSSLIGTAVTLVTAAALSLARTAARLTARRPMLPAVLPRTLSLPAWPISARLQPAYAIGVAEPVSIMVDTFGTSTIEHDKLEAVVRKVFDLTPAAIIRDLDLRRPIYRQLAAYGHMGREELGVKWENTDRVEALKAAVAEL